MKINIILVFAFFFLFWDSRALLPSLSSNMWPSCLRLLRIWDYRCKPWHQANKHFIYRWIHKRRKGDFKRQDVLVNEKQSRLSYKLHIYDELINKHSDSTPALITMSCSSDMGTQVPSLNSFPSSVPTHISNQPTPWHCPCKPQKIEHRGNLPIVLPVDKSWAKL